ncbi:hypothetical protein RJ641_033698 [Dillenia turbinata]|uniref:Uncharacterized protein n=1 Tax=Dillenia turbinata TaxID=194707 RepID=A0AAN8VKA4_9MAGN
MYQDRCSQDNVSIVIANLGQAHPLFCLSFLIMFVSIVHWRTDWQSLPLQKPNFIYELDQAFATIGIVSLGIWMSSQFSL